MAFTISRRRSAPLYWSAAVLLTLVAESASAQAPVAVSPEFKKLLDANTWQLEYQLTFKATSSGTGKSLTGPVSYQGALSFEASETLTIDSRSQGASLSMQKLTGKLADPAAAASMQKAMMDIIMQSDNIASWMMVGSGLADLGDDPTPERLRDAAVAAGKKSIGTMKVDFSSESRGDNLVNELGDKYKQIVRRTRRGTGGVASIGQMATLEVNGVTKRVSLMLPVTLPSVTDATLTEEVVTTTELPPGSKPAEERSTSTQRLDSFPGQITVTEAALAFGGGSGVLIDDPVVVQGGKISGQHTGTATYKQNNEPVSGTLVIKYTLTPR